MPSKCPSRLNRVDGGVVSAILPSSRSRQKDSGEFESPGNRQDMPITAMGVCVLDVIVDAMQPYIHLVRHRKGKEKIKQVRRGVSKMNEQDEKKWTSEKRTAEDGYLCK